MMPDNMLWVVYRTRGCAHRELVERQIVLAPAGSFDWWQRITDAGWCFHDNDGDRDCGCDLVIVDIEARPQEHAPV